MATRSSYPFNSPIANDYDAENNDENSPSSRPLSGTGASRQTRRLQLRNAGFRGGAVPTRKVTPKSNSTSASGLGVSDSENVSPAGNRSGSLNVSKRQSSGILQEIGNSTLTRPKKVRPRMASARLFAMDSAGTEALGDDDGPLSPPLPKTTIRPKTVKTRAKMANKRRSVSAEMSKYIDHLEMELVSAQSQLSAMTSPSVTREQHTKERNQNAETKHLQQELDEWEAKYERRVQEAMDEHVAIENGLRNRIRSLEQEAEETRFKLQELEMQLDNTTESMHASETANVNLEKRLEIMSELLATSPTKIDLHAPTPGRRKRQQRPQSMLPRFPTASSLMGSPERQSFTQPASPLLSFANYSPDLAFSPMHDNTLRLDHSPQPSDAEQTDAESVFSDAHGTADSVTSMETSETQPPYNPWSLPPVREIRSKPARRMRRFGAGSQGPKPLILPSTAHCEQYPPASAPPLERSETTPAFFPQTPAAEAETDDDFPLFGRRRASTTPGEIRISSLEAPPAFLEVSREEEASLGSLLTPHAEQFGEASSNFSSIGTNAGMNLMEELRAIPSNESSGSYFDGDDDHIKLNLDDELASPGFDNSRLHDLPQPTSPNTSLNPTSPSTQRPTAHSRTRSTSALHPTLPLFDRLRLLFGDLWRSPVALARHLIQTAQARIPIPSPLVNVQWWLVGVLLGPMARRRMVQPSRTSSACCGEDEGSSSSSPLRLENGGEEALAYGTFPPAQRQGSLTGKGKKRASSKTSCAHLQQRRKHSPLLWLKFSLTLAFAVGAAFKDGPGSLLKGGGCGCWGQERERRRGEVGV